MAAGTVHESQSQAARVAGLSYLLALPPAIFAEFYVRARLVVSGNAVLTAQHIVAHERLFRLGIASNLSVFAIDIALITALYLVLKPVHERLALLALGWGLIETAILVGVTLSDFDVLRILSGADYLHPFAADQVAALARLSVGAHDSGYLVGLVFAGLRSTTFCSLWFRSRLIPRALAVWGILASFLMGACAIAFIVFPNLAHVVGAEIYGGPIFLFELSMGFWLLLKRLRPPVQARA
jgi:hypothetical protein